MNAQTLVTILRSAVGTFEANLALPPQSPYPFPITSMKINRDGPADDQEETLELSVVFSDGTSANIMVSAEERK